MNTDDWKIRATGVVGVAAISFAAGFYDDMFFFVGAFVSGLLLVCLLHRSSVPRCEDCKLRRGHFCGHGSSHIAGIYYAYADVMRERGMPCGKRGRYFEPKEGA